MSDPIKYNPGYSFSAYQASNPSDPLPAPQVDTELANISNSVNQTIDGLRNVRRSDGKLQNGIVTRDSLALGISLAAGVPVPWAPGTQYAKDFVVFVADSALAGFYICLVGHTSGSSFQADLTTGYWRLASQMPSGDDGWTIALEIVTDGARCVLRVASFIGGTGTPPAGVGLYIGATGLVSDIAAAVDIRGQTGPQGTRGLQWKGTWSNVTAYAANDLVVDVDSLGHQLVWIAKGANANVRPKDTPASWDYFPGSFPGTVDDGLWSDPTTETYNDGTWA